MSGYYNKELGTDVDINDVTNNPIVSKFGQLSEAEMKVILDAPLSDKPTYVQLGDHGEVLISMNLKLQLENYLQTGSVTKDEKVDLRVKTIGGLTPEAPGGRTFRWPRDSKVDAKTDYVFFQFGKYEPPFSSDVAKLRTNANITNLARDSGNGIQDRQIRNALIENSTTSATYEMYRNSEAINVAGQPDIMLPMPQDLSNELQAQWQGKQFTATGRAAVAALGAGQFSYAKEVVKNIAGNAKALQTALNASVLNSIPGVGGNLSFNDVSGSTRGIVINPNAELLYDSPEMREIGMIFKLVAQNEDEARDIQKICNIFRKASLPTWGGGGNEIGIFDGESEISGSNQWNSGDKKGDRNDDGTFDIGGEDNWIRVPMLCKFTFMHGDEVNRKLVQFKPCAIQAVEVNYTPDGTYSAYRDGSPVAIELRLNFMETKLIFADEVAVDEMGMGY